MDATKPYEFIGFGAFRVPWILGRVGFKLARLWSISEFGNLLGLPGAAHGRSNAIRKVFKLNDLFES